MSHTVHNFFWTDFQHNIAYATSKLSQLFLVIYIALSIMLYTITYIFYGICSTVNIHAYLSCDPLLHIFLQNPFPYDIHAYYVKKKFPEKYIIILHEEIGSQHETNAKKRCCQHWVHSFGHWAINGRIWISLHHTLINKKIIAK